MIHRPRFALVVLAPAFLLAACSAVGGAAPGASLDLVGRQFVSSLVNVGGVARPLVGGSAISLAITSDNLTASAGCNTFGAAYRLDGDTLRIDQGASTEMGCPPALMAQDSWLFGLLGSAPTLSAPDADRLTLTAGTTVISFTDRRVAQPDLPLTGGTWTLDGLVTGQTASSVPAVVRAHVEFKADGTVAFDSGCNGGGGRWELISGTGSSGTLRLSQLLTTAMACQEPMASVEASFRAVVRSGATVAYSITGSRLTLTIGDRGLDFSS